MSILWSAKNDGNPFSGNSFAVTSGGLFDTAYSTTATLLPLNTVLTYRQLLSRTCEKILDLAKPFTDPGGKTSYKNLIALNEGCPVGQWRDSTVGLGEGRYPYDVNTALMPAALRAIADLGRVDAIEGGSAWSDLADKRAEVWETSAPEFFAVNRRSP